MEHVPIIGLKALGNFSDPFWSNKMTALLWEVPKPHNSMIYGFLDLWEPAFIDLNIPKYFKHIKNMGTFRQVSL